MCFSRDANAAAALNNTNQSHKANKQQQRCDNHKSLSPPSLNITSSFCLFHRLGVKRCTMQNALKDCIGVVTSENKFVLFGHFLQEGEPSAGQLEFTHFAK